MTTNYKLVKINLLWSKIRKKKVTFRPASTGLDHTLVACDLTQILAEGSGCRWGRAAGTMRDHDSCWGPVVLYDLLDFASVPLTTYLDVVLPVLRCSKLVLQRSLQKCPFVHNLTAQCVGRCIWVKSQGTNVWSRPVEATVVTITVSSRDPSIRPLDG